MQPVMKRLCVLFLVLSFVMVLSPTYICAEKKEGACPGKININTASSEELTSLKRIGPKYAQRIVDYRINVGPFEKARDIMKVKGIGPKTFEANKDVITVK